MVCINPQTIKSAQTPVNCGVCFACLERRRQDWAFRITQEIKVSSGALFITLTYAEDTLPMIKANGKWYATLLKSDPQKFMKKLRKKQSTKIKYYMVGEYGTELNRPHYHYIIFNLELQTIKDLEDTWGLGMVHIGKAEPKSITYVTGYLINNWISSVHRQKPFAMMSKGLGENYLHHSKEYHKQNQKFNVRKNNRNYTLPRYYRDKIFSDKEKELYRQKMAKQMAIDNQREYDDISKRGNNPWTYKQAQYQQKINSINKSKKSKLL